MPMVGAPIQERGMGWVGWERMLRWWRPIPKVMEAGWGCAPYCGRSCGSLLRP